MVYFRAGAITYSSGGKKEKAGRGSLHLLNVILLSVPWTFGQTNSHLFNLLPMNGCIEVKRLAYSAALQEHKLFKAMEKLLLENCG